MTNNNNLTIAKDMVKINQLIPSNIHLKREGSNYRATTCPICGGGNHFTIYNDGKSWKAWNCISDGGTVLDYIMAVEKIELNEAINRLLEIANLNNFTKEELNNMNTTITKREQVKVKQYNNPINKTEYLKDISGKCLDYCKSRGLTDDTINHFNLRQYTNKGYTNIVFPYYEASIEGYVDNNIIAGKVRKPEKVEKGNLKYWTLKIEGYEDEGSYTDYGCIFNEQNIHSLINYKYNIGEKLESIIVTEGEFDTMIAYQAGYENVVSIPNGVAGAEKVIEARKDFFDKFDRIIVISDADEAGIKMDEAFLNVYGDKACFIDKKLFPANYDINQVYYKAEFIDKTGGAEAIRRIVNSAKIDNDGIESLDATKYYDKLHCDDNMFYIPTGFPTIDNALNDLQPGFVSIIAGKEHSGKSTIADKMQLNAMKHGHGVLRVDGEATQQIVQGRLYRKIIGNDKTKYDVVKKNKKEKLYPKITECIKISEWEKDKNFLIDALELNTDDMDGTFTKIEKYLNSRRIGLLILDNMMTLVPNDDNYLSNQSKFMEKCCKLARKHNVHVLILAHFKKEDRNLNPTSDSIYGSSNIRNKADVILLVERNFNDERISTPEGTIPVKGYISLVKNRMDEDGELAFLTKAKNPEEQDIDRRVKLAFDKTTNNVYEVNSTWGICYDTINYEVDYMKNQPMEEKMKYIETLDEDEKSGVYDTIIISDGEELPY